VHGPLIATYLMELFRSQDGRPLKTFRFRAISPTFDIAPFSVHGKPTETGVVLWAQGASGDLRMDAVAEFA
jgi:3-methylfumaryl-CoA hydratase